MILESLQVIQKKKNRRRDQMLKQRKKNRHQGQRILKRRGAESLSELNVGKEKDESSSGSSSGSEDTEQKDKKEFKKCVVKLEINREAERLKTIHEIRALKREIAECKAENERRAKRRQKRRDSREKEREKRKRKRKSSEKEEESLVKSPKCTFESKKLSFTSGFTVSRK